MTIINETNMNRIIGSIIKHQHSRYDQFGFQSTSIDESK